MNNRSMPQGQVIPELAYPDLAGHSWTFTQSIEDVDPATWGGRVPERGS